jgi:hypothetical protein
MEYFLIRYLHARDVISQKVQNHLANGLAGLRDIRINGILGQTEIEDVG